MKDHLLEINDLKVSFFTPAGEVKAVNGVSYDLDEGRVLGIVGESGSGKSVSVSAMMQLLAYPGRVVGGSITFNGQDVLAMNAEQIQAVRGKEIGMMKTNLGGKLSISVELEENDHVDVEIEKM